MLYFGLCSTLSVIFSPCVSCSFVFSDCGCFVAGLISWSAFFGFNFLFFQRVQFCMICRGTIMGQFLVVIIIFGVNVDMIFVGSRALLLSVLISSAVVLCFAVHGLPCLAVVLSSTPSCFLECAFVFFKLFVPVFCCCFRCGRVCFILISVQWEGGYVSTVLLVPDGIAWGF